MTEKKNQNILFGTLLVLGIVFFLAMFFPIFMIVLVFNPIYNMAEVTTQIMLWQLLFGLLYLGIFVFVCWSIFCVGKLVYSLYKKRKIKINKRKAIAFFIFAFLIFISVSSFIPRQISFLLDPIGMIEAQASGPPNSLAYQNDMSDENITYGIKVAIVTVGGWFFGTLMYVLAGLYFVGALKTR